MCVCACVCACVCVHVCMLVCLHMCVHTCTCVHVCMLVSFSAQFTLVVDHVKYEYSIGRSRAAVRHPPGV